MDEVLDLLAALGDEVKLLAGGQSLIPLMNMRLARPEHLVDLGRVTGISDVVADGGGLRIGAMVRHRTVETDPLVRAATPLLCEAASQISHFQIRERGTLGGALAHADPAGEMPLVATVLEARIGIRSATADRTQTAGEFFESVFTTSLAPEEALVDAVYPRFGPGDGWAIEEVARRQGDFAIVSVAIWLTADAGRCRRLRIGVGGVSATPFLSRRAVDVGLGEALGPALSRAVAAAVAAEIDPSGDIHASAADRRDMARSLVVRAMNRATTRGLATAAAGASSSGAHTGGSHD
jgi:carbon-monoxide dehydrogenase medium subunit